MSYQTIRLDLADRVATLNQPLPEVLEIERRNPSQAGYTADFREALSALAEKRAPVFEGC